MFHFYYHPWYFSFQWLCEQSQYYNFLAYVPLLKKKIIPAKKYYFHLKLFQEPLSFWSSVTKQNTSPSASQQFSSINISGFGEIG